MANVLITGATKGIGRAIAERFAKAGCHLLLTARSLRDLEAAADEIAAQYPGCRVSIQMADMADTAQIAALATKAQQLMPTLDVLVNNAGLFLPDDLLSEPDARLTDMLAVNVVGPHHLCRAVQHLLPRGGHIFNICSVASLAALPNCGSYVVSKHAMLGLTRALRLALRERGIRVTAILPGGTWSDSWAGAELPVERLMQPTDVASALFSAWTLGSSAVVEELLVRPMLGDL